jgi:hypothetical protein
VDGVREAAVPGFLPSRDALPIPNAFPAGGFPYPAVAIPGLDRLVALDAGDGICGGLVFATLDLHRARRSPKGSAALPAPDGPLFRRLVARQRASVLALDRRTPMTNGGKAVLWAHRRGDRAAGGALSRETRAEWPAVRADLDAGRLSPLYLVAGPRVRPGDVRHLVEALRHSHQVLAYGYREQGDGRVVLRVVDPNDPADDSAVLSFRLRGGPLAIEAPEVERRLGRTGSFRGWFRAAYRPDPRPLPTA